jgi:hypothetical protein
LLADLKKAYAAVQAIKAKIKKIKDDIERMEKKLCRGPEDEAKLKKLKEDLEKANTAREFNEKTQNKTLAEVAALCGPNVIEVSKNPNWTWTALLSAITWDLTTMFDPTGGLLTGQLEEWLGLTQPGGAVSGPVKTDPRPPRPPQYGTREVPPTLIDYEPIATQELSGPLGPLRGPY